MWNNLVSISGAVKNASFAFFIFRFSAFLARFAKNLMKKPPAFMTDIISSHKLLLLCKNLKSRNLWQRSDGPINILEKLHGGEFLPVIFGTFTDN